MTKIIDNSSAKKLLEQLRALESLEGLYEAMPFAKSLFPRAATAFAQFQEIKKKAEILLIPDQFNETFSKVGWIAYESLNLDIMITAISIEKGRGIVAAEQALANHYDEKTLKYGIMRFRGHVDFLKRIRLIELAQEDYLAGRFHACIPLLLALLDGLVNDVSRHIGFFADEVDMTAWDSVAAHETGLMALVKVMNLSRKKTNEGPINIPFRHGILHGRELAFDNHIVAAKCWAALLAVRDWAGAIASGKGEPKTSVKPTLAQLLQQIVQMGKSSEALDAWQSRRSDEMSHLPHSGQSTALPDGTPERAVAEFLENWCHGRFGLMADALWDCVGEHRGKKAGRTKKEFSQCIPESYIIISVLDQTAAISHVETDIVFRGADSEKTIRVNVRAIFISTDNYLATHRDEAGSWRLFQNCFGKIIYGAPPY